MAAPKYGSKEAEEETEKKGPKRGDKKLEMMTYQNGKRYYTMLYSLIVGQMRAGCLKACK